MKRLFPIIITLTVISLLGIIFLQVQWIRSAIHLKQDQLITSVDNAMNNIADSIIEKKTNPNMRMNFEGEPQDQTSSSTTTRQVLTRYEIKHLIGRSFEDEGLEQDFEYCITNEAAQTVLYSTGFRTEYLKSKNTYSKSISGRISSNNEILHINILQPEDYFQRQLLMMILGAILFTAIIIAAFVLTIRTMLNQKKLSEIKSDFINNMTHEFKTPIATIQLAGDALKNEKVQADKESIQYYTGMIQEENKRMNKQVEKILNAAQLEKEELRLHLKTIEVNSILKKVSGNTQIKVEDSGGSISTELKADNSFIEADEVHFSNIVFNLVDNAIKYCANPPNVIIRTENVGKFLHIKVIDNGIGMSKETMNHVFEKFYRAHTGNVHDVKGFGLGLAYVKRVVDAHEAKIKVESKLGEGSSFTLIFPIAS